MPVACLRIPHFGLRVALLDRPELDGAPLILGTAGGRAVVADATPEASAKGLRPGMTLREANALCPETLTLLPNPAKESDLQRELLDRLERFSPAVEPDENEAGCWYVDLTGLERHHGAPLPAARRLLQLVSPALRPRAGVAPGKFVARIAAGVAAPGTVRTVAPAEVGTFLAAASVTWLPLPAGTITQLQRLGLETLGALAALPGAKVAARFGPEGRYAWELARGRDNSRVIPRPKVATVVETLSMPAPAVSREMLLVGLRQLVGRAFGRPVLHGRYVRQVTLRLLIENNRSWERLLTLREPCGAPRLIEALDLRLQALELPGPVIEVAIELSGIIAETARQEPFALMRPRRAPPLVAAVRHLKQRYGTSPVYRIVEVEPWSRIPERRHALISYDP